jgi:hypothetical protein
MKMTPTELKHFRQARELRRWLRALVRDSRIAVRLLDEEMAKPASAERGRRIARITNALRMSVDMAERFGLGK